MKRQFVPAFAAWLLIAAGICAQEEEAVRVYRDVQGCVVALENMEGSGTGIVLDTTGLILTNAHVVASPLPYECKVDLRRASQSQTVTFKNVKILGVHPQQDLALVRIDPQEHKGVLQPAELARTKAAPGQRVYAIGNPSGGGGVVLSKTITDGIVSGVDRVIDGVSYYQIDAPINAGNSGGPLCDKSGQVIGLVTLKFTDVENIGFAIPLHTLNPAEFIPLVRRQGNPARVRELVKAANDFYQKSRAIRQREGSATAEAKLYDLYAAKFYHLALANDPGNDALYYNVGMLLRGLDADDVAAAYLLQAIELNPWGRGNADYFRELGFALVKQKKFDEAQAAWEEGVAKFPVKGTKIWEDLIIFYRNERRDFYQSAYAAAVVLHLNDPRSRVAMGKQLFGESRELLDEKDKVKLDAAVARIETELRQRVLATAKVHKANKPYLTEAFARYVESSGTLGRQNDPAPAPQIEPGPDRTPEPPSPPGTAERPELDLGVPSGSHDLLGDVNPTGDAVQGGWKFDGKLLVTPVSPHARLQLPAKPPAEYDLTLIVERKSNLKEFVVGFVRDGVLSALLFDVDGNASGLDPGGRGAYRGRVLAKDRPATIVCKIRHEGLLVSVDGRKIFFERTAGAFPHVPDEWKVPDASKLFVGSHISKFYIHKMMLTPYRRR